MPQKRLDKPFRPPPYEAASKEHSLKPFASASAAKPRSEWGTLNKVLSSPDLTQKPPQQLFASQAPSPSASRLEYFDVLPSFQMFQSILKRNDFEFDEDTLGAPPQYERSSPSPPPRERERDIDTVIQDEELEHGVYFSDNESDTPHPAPASPAAHTAPRAGHAPPGSRGVISHEAYGTSVVDNIDRLPVAKSLPLDIQIYVTKDVPIPNEKNELQTRLKEYSSGDIVNGYVVITNTLNKSVDFGLFTVSLEGTVKVHTLGPDGKRRIVTKKFLKMFDLNASYNYGIIPSSAGIHYEPYLIDASDGCIMGLPDDRILQPQQKYKKFITFKFPAMLLDNACLQNIFRHTMPPPSFGVDESAFGERASTIELNKLLGYGYLSVRGLPVLVRDYAFPHTSISYTVEAKFIDKKFATNQALPVHAHEINDPNNPSQYVISKSAQYFLRFVPDVSLQVETYSKTYTFLSETFDKIGIDGVLASGLSGSHTWRFVRNMNASIEQEIEDALDRKEMSDSDVKAKQVRHAALKGPALERGIAGHLESPAVGKRGPAGYVESPATSISSRKFKFLQAAKTGDVRVLVRVPAKILRYGSPSLIQKYNSTPLLLPVSSRDGLALLPVTSNIEEIYNRNSAASLLAVQFELVYTGHDPPEIAQVVYSIVAWSYSSSHPFPVSLDHDFFYKFPYGSDVQLNLEALKEQLNGYIKFLKDSHTEVSRSAYSYLKGLTSMSVKKDVVKDYFHKAHAGDLEEGEWVKVDGLWRKKVSAKLRVKSTSLTLVPSFQHCLLGRLYCLQVCVRFKGESLCCVDVPILVG